MRRRMRPFLLLATVLAAGCTISRNDLPYYTSADLTPQWSAAASKKHRVADFALVNQAGDTVRAEQLRGKVYIASFFFTSCKQICPRLTTRLAKVQERFAEHPDVLLVSHSITPEADDIAVLARYARINRVRDGKWHLLTGDKATIQRLARESYFVEIDELNFSHTEVLLLVDQAGAIRGVYNGSLEYEVGKLVADVISIL